MVSCCLDGLLPCRLAGILEEISFVLSRFDLFVRSFVRSYVRTYVLGSLSTCAHFTILLLLLFLFSGIDDINHYRVALFCWCSLDTTVIPGEAGALDT